MSKRSDRRIRRNALAIDTDGTFEDQPFIKCILNQEVRAGAFQHVDTQFVFDDVADTDDIIVGGNRIIGITQTCFGNNVIVRRGL